MGLLKVVDGYQPICNDCGIALCFSISEEEYKRTKGFWENWKCVYCDKHAIGSFARWLESHKNDDE